MKFGSIIDKGVTVPVVQVDAGLVALSDLGPWRSLREFIGGGDEALATLRTALDRGGQSTIDEDRVTWSPPIPDPSKMLFIALNNSAIDKMLFYRPDFPVYFPKLPSTLAGNDATLQLHDQYGLTHMEPELGVVIGREARHVSLDDAIGHVFGYTVINDVTSAGMRQEDKYFGRYPMPRADGGFDSIDEHLLYPGRYKNADGFAPMGPLIVTRDEIADPLNLRVRGWIDGELYADDNTANYHFTIAEVIHWISMHSTLFPGDIISMGTALHPDAKGKPLASGDVNSFGQVMEVEIESIGRIRTPIERVRQPDPRRYFATNRRFVKTLVE